MTVCLMFFAQIPVLFSATFPPKTQQSFFVLCLVHKSETITSSPFNAIYMTPSVLSWGNPELSILYNIVGVELTEHTDFLFKMTEIAVSIFSIFF